MLLSKHSSEKGPRMQPDLPLASTQHNQLEPNEITEPTENKENKKEPSKLDLAYEKAAAQLPAF